MTKMDYLELLVDEIHSTTVATIGSDGHPQTRIIDMMYYDEEGVYFLTATGKTFYDQLMEQQYVAISATKDKIAVSLRGKIKNIGKKNLDIMFEKNPYMKKIYPGDTKDAIEVFRLYEAQGEYFDISNPSKYCEGYYNNWKNRGSSDRVFYWKRMYWMQTVLLCMSAKMH